MNKKYTPQVLLVLAFILLAQATFAKELLPFASEEGVARLQRSEHKAGAFKLMNNYRTQIDKVSCGLVTSAIVLNALRNGTETAPFAPMKEQFIAGFPSKDVRKPELGPMEGRLRVYTPENFMNDAAVAIKPLEVIYYQTGVNPGLTLTEMSRILEQAHNVNVEKIGIGTQQTAVIPPNSRGIPPREGTLPAEIANQALAKIQKAVQTPGVYVIANYDRPALGQKGGGHISPIAAYDQQSDSYLILDVNPQAAQWIWASSEDLINGMNTYDSDAQANRGLLIVSEKQQN